MLSSAKVRKLDLSAEKIMGGRLKTLWRRGLSNPEDEMSDLVGSVGGNGFRSTVDRGLN